MTTITRNRTQPKPGTRGNSAIEFAIVVIAAVPMLFGMIALGISLGRGIEAIQVTRDVAHMYALGTDFTQTGARNIVSKLAQDFNLSPTGTAVLILSTVQKVSQADCNGAPTVPCNNLGLPVVTYRYTIGNTSLRQSAFATPIAARLVNGPRIASRDYLQYSDLRAISPVYFDTVLNLDPGDFTTMVEGYFEQPELNFLRAGSSSANRGTYVRALF